MDPGSCWKSNSNGGGGQAFFFIPGDQALIILEKYTYDANFIHM